MIGFLLSILWRFASDFIRKNFVNSLLQFWTNDVRLTFHDTYAFRIPGHEHKNAKELWGDGNVSRSVFTGMDPLPCLSCFGGVTLYRNLDLLLEAGGYPEDTEDCEHVAL